MPKLLQQRHGGESSSWGALAALPYGVLRGERLLWGTKRGKADAARGAYGSRHGAHGGALLVSAYQ